MSSAGGDNAEALKRDQLFALNFLSNWLCESYAASYVESHTHLAVHALFHKLQFLSVSKLWTKSATRLLVTVGNLAREGSSYISLFEPQGTAAYKALGRHAVITHDWSPECGEPDIQEAKKVWDCEKFAIFPIRGPASRECTGCLMAGLTKDCCFSNRDLCLLEVMANLMAIHLDGSANKLFFDLNLDNDEKGCEPLVHPALGHEELQTLSIHDSVATTCSTEEHSSSESSTHADSWKSSMKQSIRKVARKRSLAREQSLSTCSTRTCDANVSNHNTQQLFRNMGTELSLKTQELVRSDKLLLQPENLLLL